MIFSTRRSRSLHITRRLLPRESSREDLVSLDEHQPANGSSTVRILVVGRTGLENQLASMRARALELGRTDMIMESHKDVPRGGAVDALVALPRVTVGASEMDALRGLRIICTPSVGTDHIDLEAAAQRGIRVANAPGFNTAEVAEHTITLAAMMLRDVWASAQSVGEGRWSSDMPRPKRLSGSRIGLVGYGAIARKTARIARDLGMQVSVWSRSTPAGDLGDGIRSVATLEELLADQDVISLHLPLTEQTHHLLNDNAFARMRPDTIIVNTSRGGLVDSQALVRALDDGRISGAALDVLEREPPIPNDPLLTDRRVLITPHIAWLSPASAVLAYQKAIDSIHTALPR
jgi:phosphoglycerate dehydrogenase-like enzyme